MREITTSRSRHLYALKDTELNGGLRAYLIDARDKKKSYIRIAAELSQSGATVGKTTVFEWVKENQAAN